MIVIPKKLNRHVLMACCYIIECAQTDRSACLKNWQLCEFTVRLIDNYPKEWEFCLSVTKKGTRK
jgi:hypothetical protein